MAELAFPLVLTEYQPTVAAPGAFTEDLARLLDSRYKGVIAIEPPSYRNGGQWVLSPQGWVGFLPLPGHPGLSLQPKVPLGNIFRMLEYAYDLTSFRMLPGLFDAESIREFFDRLARILVRRVLDRASRGLYRAYEEREERLALVRGRLDMVRICREPETCLLPCIYQEHTPDVDENRIIAWTLRVLCGSWLLSQECASLVRQADRMLRGTVSLRPCRASDCGGRVYNRLNEDYHVLHSLCRFFLDNTGPTQQLGETAMVPFLVNMAGLFERFVARWTRQNVPPEYRLQEQETLNVDEEGMLSMRIDLVLYRRVANRPLCVLDTKYKLHGMVANDDYNQVVAYALNKQCGDAMLIYPKELQRAFHAERGGIRVQNLTFDVGGDLEAAGKAFLGELLAAIGA
jgi:5-methylcytosine-specific restriction enzyme subunit McrC